MKLIIIAGFHRSGTSMLTRMFHSAGLFVGNKLLGALPSNPYGHFEDEEIVKIHDDILMENGFDWMIDADVNFKVSQRILSRILNLIRERSVHHQIWGFKDPRVCLFLNTWSNLVPEALFVVVFRDFIETTNSLLKRHSRDIILGNGNFEKHIKFWNDPDYAYRMWLVHTQHLVNLIESQPNRIVSFTHPQIIQGLDPINKVNSKFGLNLDKIKVKDMIDLDVISNQLMHLPKPSPALKIKLVSLWKKIQSLTNDYSHDIENRLNSSTAPVPTQEIVGESLSSHNINNINCMSIDFYNQLNEAFLENKKLINTLKKYK